MPMSARLDKSQSFPILMYAHHIVVEIAYENTNCLCVNCLFNSTFYFFWFIDLGKSLVTTFFQLFFCNLFSLRFMQLSLGFFRVALTDQQLRCIILDPLSQCEIHIFKTTHVRLENVFNQN